MKIFKHPSLIDVRFGCFFAVFVIKYKGVNKIRNEVWKNGKG